jgi:hypothetical protein
MPISKYPLDSFLTGGNIASSTSGELDNLTASEGRNPSECIRRYSTNKKLGGVEDENDS